ncbi:hypothetical protein OBBRIDRAFT_727608 [Obba rivulosa]|uniref:PB1 domain-containing protein n=1 Tax=Obba rivulosa TaxID=1052685 RepID=A0A8E2B1C6_9APHY|nr:hypothetical protein OBBRIDRAFT_727608 [Obba rivulosa]
MSLKAELETWAQALSAYDAQDFDRSLSLFSQIADSSKILFNIGIIYATLGEHEAAIDQFDAAVQLDQYLAVAYFQLGVSHFLLNAFTAARAAFTAAHTHLRGNPRIEYVQLGLGFTLYEAEVLFNEGLDWLRKAWDAAQDAEKGKGPREEHRVIEEALRDRGVGYTVFSVPVGVLYRPAESKIRNAKAKDYLGKAKLVAASDEMDVTTEFSGVARLRQGITPTGVYLDDATGLQRARTVAGSEHITGSSDPEPAALQRAKTTINTVTVGTRSGPSSPARDRDERPPIDAPRAGGLVRSNTMAARAPAPAMGMVMGGASMNANMGVGMGGPTRGLSIRRPEPPMRDTRERDLPPQPPRDSAYSPDSERSVDARARGRMTEFYDDYIDAYSERNSGPPPSVARSKSMGGVRRRGTRKGPAGRRWEEEEEGYESAEWEEETKIRVKIHHSAETRGMALARGTALGAFRASLGAKFGLPANALALQFADEDGERVSLRDATDWEMALETAARAGRLEVWCDEE